MLKVFFLIIFQDGYNIVRVNVQGWNCRVQGAPPCSGCSNVFDSNFEFQNLRKNHFRPPEISMHDIALVLVRFCENLKVGSPTFK